MMDRSLCPCVKAQSEQDLLHAEVIPRAICNVSSIDRHKRLAVIFCLNVAMCNHLTRYLFTSAKVMFPQYLQTDSIDKV